MFVCDMMALADETEIKKEKEKWNVENVVIASKSGILKKYTLTPAY